jgi:hypothetical protein
MHPVDYTVDVVHVPGHQGEVLQTVIPKTAFTAEVAVAAAVGEVVGTVVLTHHAGFDIEQVGYAQQFAGQREQGAIADRSRQAGVENQIRRILVSPGERLRWSASSNASATRDPPFQPCLAAR